MYTTFFSTLICCGWTYGAPLHCNTCVRSGGELLESWGVAESEWYCGVMVEAMTPQYHSLSATYCGVMVEATFRLEGQFTLGTLYIHTHLNTAIYVGI